MQDPKNGPEDRLIDKLARDMQKAMKESGFKCAVILNDMYLFVPYEKPHS